MGTVDHVIEDGIATVTFTNPPKGFFTSDMVARLGEVMTALEHDPAVRVIIFTGGCRTSSSGTSRWKRSSAWPAR